MPTTNAIPMEIGKGDSEAGHVDRRDQQQIGEIEQSPRRSMR